MRTLLQAGFVSIDEIGGALIVGFADQQFGTSQYLMLQRMLDPNDDDGVYLERNDQVYGTSAQVLSCRLERERIELTVDDMTARKLGAEETFAIEFSCDEEKWQRLRVELGRIFAGTDCSVEV
jgi:hypothetical protein